MRRVFVRLMGIGLFAAGTLLAGCDSAPTTPAKPAMRAEPSSRPADPGKPKLPVDPG